MPKYIEFIAKVVRSESKRKTRKRGGGDITTCNFTPLTEEFTVSDLKTKIQHPHELKNLELIDRAMSGAFNIARRARCSKTKKGPTSEEIICRVWKKAFYVDGRTIRCVRTYPGCVEDSLESFAKELTISIFHSNCGNTLPIYDIQAISINNPLLSFLSEDQKRKMFGQNAHDNCLCLCVIMKKGEPYKITRANFHKTMELFGNIAEEHLCVDIKPDNLLSSNGRVVMIDWDPQFIQETTESIDIFHDPKLFNSCMMKYLFCMFLLIQQILNDDFLYDVISELNKIIKTPILLTDGRSESVLFIISSFYNNTDRSEGLCLSRKLGHNFKKTFDIYLWAGFEDFDLDLYMEVRPYLINCPKKAHCEYLCLQNEGNYTVKYDNSTKSLRYYINHQCPPWVFHGFTSLIGFHNCSTELTGVELTYDKAKQNVSIIYDGNRKKNVEETDTKDDSKTEIKKRKKVKARVK